MNAESAMAFDPYSAWIGLPPGPRPPDPYSLLGLPRYERDPARIVAAAAERARLVNRKAPFDRGEEMREVLAEISAAERLLSDPARRREAEVGLRSLEKTRLASAPRVRQPAKATPAMTAPAKTLHQSHVVATRSNGPLRRVGVILGAVVAATLSAAAAWVAWPRSENSPEGRPSGAVAAQDRLEKAPPVVPPRPTRRPAIDPGPPVEAPRPGSLPFAAAPIAQSPEIPVPPAPSGFAKPALVPVEAARPAYDPIAEYRLPRFDSDADREAYAKHLGNLLSEAFELKGDAAAMAGHLREADALAPGNPFTQYAAAVAYWKRLKFADAGGHLDKAQGPDADPFLPARRAAIRLELNRNRRTRALSQVVGFASVLGARREAVEDEAAEASIRWLGRLVSALESPWLPGAAPPKEVADADAKARAALGPEALAGYEAGRRSLLDDYAARAAAVEADIAELAIAHEAERTETLNEITANRDEAAGQREEAVRTASEWKDWLDQETKGIDEELKQLDGANQQLTVQAEAAAATYLALSGEITRQQALDEANGSGDPLGRSRVSAQTIAMANQALAELKLLNARIAEVQGRARVLLTKRQAVVAKFERETKTLAAKTDSLRKWENVLKRRAEKTGAEEAGDTPAAKALRRRLRDFDTYLPFDLTAERDAVLRALRESR